MAEEEGGERHHMPGGFGRHDPERAWNDRAYIKTYDHDHDEGRGSRFLEDADEIRLSKMGNRIEGPYPVDDAGADAPAQIQSIPYLGEFAIPAENTWAGQAELVQGDEARLGFDAERHYVDKIIAERLKMKALTDPKNKHYAQYAGLRDNIAVLRNAVMGMYDPIDEANVQKIIGIAETLGDALASDTFASRPFSQPMSVDVANVEGVGAAEMYKYLLAVQSQPGMFQTIVRNFRSMLGLPNREWNLPPLEQTPFSDENLSKPLPDPCAPCAQQAAEQEPSLIADLPEDVARLVAISQHAGEAVRNLDAIETMNEPDRRQSVEEAHTILGWLRNLQGTDKDMAEWLSVGTPPEQLAKAEALQQLVRIYATQLHEARARQSGFGRYDDVIEDADHASGALALAVIDYTLGMLPEDHPARNRLESLKQSLPEAADTLQDQSVARLLDSMTLGLERASGQTVADQSPAERLVALSQRIQANIHKLRSVDTLEPPVREESIELAHVILEYLRKLSFRNDGLEKLADTGRPEDKLAVAQKIEELVDSYKNLLLEAAVEQPDIMQDPRIKAANDALGGIGHTVTLMAAKEMPGSIAAAQQISAVEDQSLEHLQDHHLQRVLHSAEGSTKSEAAGLSEDDQSPEDKLEAIEAAMVAVEQILHHKKKRGKSRSRSGKGAKKQQRQMQDITADDYVLKQGRFSEDARSARGDSKPGTAPRNIQLETRPMKTGKASKGGKSKIVLKDEKSPVPPSPKSEIKEIKEIKQAKEKAFMGLDPKALAAIQKEGGALRDISKQLKDLPVATVTAADSVAPDDKTFALRSSEDRERQNGKPLGPRV